MNKKAPANRKTGFLGWSAVRVSSIERHPVGLLIVGSRVTPRAATSASSTNQIVGIAYSRTARDQHQPASSRAMATSAMVLRFLGSMNLTQRGWSRRLPSSPRTRGGCRGQVPAVAHGLPDDVAWLVVPGGLDE